MGFVRDWISPATNLNHLQSDSRTKPYPISPHSAVIGHLNGQWRFRIGCDYRLFSPSEMSSLYHHPILALFRYDFRTALGSLFC